MNLNNITTALKTGITIYQYEQGQNTGSVNLMQKESHMLTQGKFLISYQIFDNIQVNNIGQTHVREILKDTQAFTINYRTEQIRDYLKYPGEELIPEHLHMINALKEIQNYWNLTSEKVIITDIIPIPQPG